MFKAHDIPGHLPVEEQVFVMTDSSAKIFFQ
jgi:hypothetical protein